MPEIVLLKVGEPGIFILSTSCRRLKAGLRMFSAVPGHGLNKSLLLQRKPGGTKVERPLWALEVGH